MKTNESYATLFSQLTTCKPKETFCLFTCCLLGLLAMALAVGRTSLRCRDITVTFITNSSSIFLLVSSFLFCNICTKAVMIVDKETKSSSCMGQPKCNIRWGAVFFVSFLPKQQLHSSRRDDPNIILASTIQPPTTSDWTGMVKTSC